MKTQLMTMIFLLSFSVMNSKDKSGVIMTVNGEDIPSSEFEYLYNKNKNQQTESLSIDDYLELFKVYRLKVAEAKSQRIDTLSSFRAEMAQYKHDLLEPYLTDTVFINNLITTSINREGEEIEASHILFFKRKNAEVDNESVRILDSLRNELINGASFEELAQKFSQDKSVANNKGYLGYVTPGRYPYNFETAVFETPEGEISEIVESTYGYQLVKPGKRRMAKGKAEAAHILKLVPKDASPETTAAIKATIDSIYNVVVQNPDEFAALAMKYSDDKGSARNGGMLRPFSTGEMVPEFEEMAFSLQDGEISQPFSTTYGFHIIKKIAQHPRRPDDEIRADVMGRISNPQDDRYVLIEKNKFDKLAKKHPEVVLRTGIDAYHNDLLEAEETTQYNENLDYRNLINEYSDGSLLYEVSLQNVWDKAVTDNEGLEAFFSQNRQKYNWDKLHAKGILVQAKNDSIAEIIKNEVKSMPYDSIVPYIKKNFNGSGFAESFIVEQGQVPIVDYLMFDGDPVKPKSKNFESAFVLEEKILENPEEVADVRGIVTVDYQGALENEWVNDLKKKYKIEVNKKELSKIKNKYKQK